MKTLHGDLNTVEGKTEMQYLYYRIVIAKKQGCRLLSRKTWKLQANISGSLPLDAAYLPIKRPVHKAFYCPALNNYNLTSMLVRELGHKMHPIS